MLFMSRKKQCCCVQAVDELFTKVDGATAHAGRLFLTAQELPHLYLHSPALYL